ncbi:dihydrolipoamide S-succinyltransferase [Streptantibioticus silvisoli]|uniref:dihydrolipoamide S-succinyltransferase n=1 Tax=Streptantibioticus silvisoli TaxID=2705255 RepID=UPI0027E33815|nr:dihydrolipoamide S-succinyltransferase [Streptantibioticus silvisoli]
MPATDAAPALTVLAPGAAIPPELPAVDAVEVPAVPTTVVEPTTALASPVRRSPVAGSAAGSATGPEVLTARIRANVSAALEAHGGDVEAATKFLDKKRALVDVMELFKLSRVGGRYEHSEFPPTADILKKRTQKGPDEIWEGRPKWRNSALVEAVKGAAEPIEVVALDMNAAFLSALKAHLPIGRLEPDTTGVHNRKRSGVHRITPPGWDHQDLPNPLGARQEPGPLWVAEPTLRLLFEASRLGLCDVPVIHESLTSGATEGLVEKLRRALVAARREAIETDDDVMYEYVKSMYSKFVSTIGESTTNRELRRPDWVHIFRAQAFANLWRKAYKLRQAGLAAPESGLAVYEMSGTDELHVRGDWRQVFTEGRAPDQVKLKRAYMIGGR